MTTQAELSARELDAATTHVNVRGGKVALARAMRISPTPAEARAWTFLRGRGVHGLKFRRQQPIRGFIVDFYCAALRLVIELDGGVHEDDAAQEADKARDQVLRALGIHVLRLRNEEATRERLASLLLPFTQNSPPPRPQGRGGRGVR